MDAIYLKITPQDLESLTDSVELHISEIEEMIPKVGGLLKIAPEERLIEVHEKELKEVLETLQSTLVEKKTLLGILTPDSHNPIIPVANFNG